MSDDSQSGGDTMRCDRCKQQKPVDEFPPLDAVVHYYDQYCEDCIEPWDEVVDV